MAEKETYLNLNTDAAQSFGVYKNTLESDLFDYVSSLNVACGLHSGDPLTILETLKKAAEKYRSVGASVGYPDLQGFGCREMNLSDDELQAIDVYQIGALSSLARIVNIKIEYVRPHGALYKQMSKDFRVALAVAEAVKSYDPWLMLLGAAGENLKKAGEYTHIKTVGEVILNREYNYDGTINFEAPLVQNREKVLYQLDSVVKSGCVRNNEGGRTRVDFGSIHLDANFEGALDIAKRAKLLVKSPQTLKAVAVKDAEVVV